MCRLAAFPPNYSREASLDILLRMEGNNTDGVGSAYVKEGQFVVDKHPVALSELLGKHKFLAHMPHPGWTIAHLRAASHGEVAERNTHPFIVDDMCLVHNGVWGAYKLPQLILGKTVKFEGETDTEVAMHTINTIGHEKFSEAVDFAGVFMYLRKDGSLWVIRTSGDLEFFQRRNDAFVVSSSLHPKIYKKAYDAKKGWYNFGPDGLMKEKHEKLSEFVSKYMGKYYMNQFSDLDSRFPDYEGDERPWSMKEKHLPMSKQERDAQEQPQHQHQLGYGGRFHEYD